MSLGTQGELVALVSRVRDEAKVLLEALYERYPELRPSDDWEAKEWNEADHPRDRIGRFTTSGGGAGDRASDIAPERVSAKQMAELAPRVPHPFTPQGPKVSRVLDVPQELEHYALPALRAIDAVHGDGELATTWLQEKMGGVRGDMIEAGEYIPGVSPMVRIHPQGPTRSLTVIHEIGHWLDDKIIGGGEEGMGTFEGAQDLKKAILRSAAVKTLKDYASKTTVRGVEVGRSKTVTYKVDKKHVGYLLLPKELFARAYTQYVVHRGGDESLRRELASRIAHPNITNRGGRTEKDLHYPAHWEPADFEPIAHEFDKLFTSKGWLKPHA